MCNPAIMWQYSYMHKCVVIADMVTIIHPCWAQLHRYMYRMINIQSIQHLVRRWSVFHLVCLRVPPIRIAVLISEISDVAVFCSWKVYVPTSSLLPLINYASSFLAKCWVILKYWVTVVYMMVRQCIWSSSHHTMCVIKLLCWSALCIFTITFVSDVSLLLAKMHSSYLQEIYYSE